MTFRRTLTTVLPVVLCLFSCIAIPAIAGPGYALAFNGTNQYVTVPDHDALTFTNAFTWEAWVQITKTNWSAAAGEDWAALFAKDSYAKEYWLAVYSNKTINVRFNANQFATNFSSTAVSTSSWQHVAATWDGTNVCYYLNGALDHTVPWTNEISNTTNVLLIGRDAVSGGRYHFGGLMDELRLWNVARSQAEIQATMNRALSGSESGLVAYWPFDDAGGTTVSNKAALTGSACNGVLSNAPAWVISRVPFTPVTNWVTTLADSGPGSLRLALVGSVAGDVIQFSTNGTITLTSGEIEITRSLTLIGPGATNMVISGNNLSRVFNISSAGATVTISGLTLRDGMAPNGADGASGTSSAPNGGNGAPGGDGGCLYNAGNLVFSGCVVTGGKAGAGGNGGGGWGPSGSPGQPGPGGGGGGIHNVGTLLLSDCTVWANMAGRGGAYGTSAFSVSTSGAGGHGGGIYNAGHLVLFTCTFDGNVAGAGYPGANSMYDVMSGGGGGSGGAIFNAGTLVMTACTLAENAGGAGAAGGDTPGTGGTGGAGGHGGGIYNSGGAGAATLRNSLIATNRSGTGGPGGTGGSAMGAAGAPGTGPDLCGAFASSGFNLLSQDAGSTGLTNGIGGNRVGSASAPIDARLGPLAKNGGPTPTRALLPGSPAIDAGDDTLIGTDQRGQPRKSGAQVDIGAFESPAGGYPPSIVTPASVSLTTDPGNLRGAEFSFTMNPMCLNGSTYIEYGISTNYGLTTGTIPVGYGNEAVHHLISLPGLLPGHVYHYRVVGVTSAGTTYGADQTFASSPVGDFNGNGVVEPDELAAVYAGYWQDHPTLITNTLGLGSPSVQLEVADSLGWDLTAMVSTDMINWTNLPVRAQPVFHLVDPGATNDINRYYRLQYP